MVKYEEETYSFRLSHLDDPIYSDTSTISSTHKQRIDSLFRDKRRQDKMRPDPVPLRPDPVPPPVNPVQEELERMFGGRDQRQRAFLDVRATVQAQIERLFADASSEPIVGTRAAPPNTPPAPHAPDPPPPPSPLALLSPPPQPPLALLSPPTPSRHHQSQSPSPTTTTSRGSRPRSGGVSPTEPREAATPRASLSSMKYRVDYLGALQLAEKATSLDVLQTPLKDLYYKYRLSVSRGKRHVPGTLQITEAGLRITHGNVESPDGHFEFTNPFPTIAVWAAVKLVIRKELAEHGQVNYTYAFLPLICDPEAQDKYNLYHPLNVPEPAVMAIQHPPMFACVMRKVGVPKVLECHGFVCQSSEDAIVMAANLYQALLENMRSEAPSEASSDTREDDRHVMSDSEMVPVRPPRKKRSHHSKSPGFGQGLRRANSEDILQSHIILDDSRVSKRRLKRSISERHPGAFLLDPGDVYTRVALPRSKSFMNVTNKYNFQDLLDDVKQKTGLNSVDEVLKQVINPRGMSFSEMDPDQREILLKLALTLSKDEIYQRSKNIMRKQTRGRSSSLMSLMDSDSDGSTISSVLKATKRSFSRLGSRASSLQSSYLKDKSPLRKLVNNKSRYTFERPGRSAGAQRRTDNKENEFSHMLEGTGRKVAPKTPMPRRNPSRANEGYVSCSECGYDSECSSKCYCSLPRRAASTKLHDKHAHKGHDSPCDCDTESCAESEKCYCSLKRVKKNGLKMYEINLDSETDTNTETTVQSAAAYKKGFGSHSNLSELESHPTSWKRNTGGSSSSTTQHKSSSLYLTEHSKSRSAGTVFSMHPEVMRKKSLSSNLSTDSEISVVHRSDGSGYHSQDSGRRRLPPHQRAASTESLLLSPRLRRHPSGSLGSGGSQGSQASSQGSGSGVGTHRSQSSRGSSTSHQKILLVSAVDPSGKVVYRGASQRQQREDSDTASILSMKKTAEIAALFSELKLNQTTDLINHLNQSASESEDDAYSSMQPNNSFLFSENIENSLGYLP
ncbi:uncharacterized protein LOC121871958 [Homarus americanus]|uniref:uncharacterized protein LOC121871958 n=1 Tax=Homarus americanus TaxID=6706 RepID=UPI001C456DE9|nr:uncharacterized protein LOC121871958 [Homarus americanus]